MSRIGKLPISIPSGVDVTCNGLDVTVKGKFGTLQNQLPDSLSIEHTDSSLVVSLKNQTRQARALHGLYRTLVNNMVIGVSEQFQLNLKLKVAREQTDSKHETAIAAAPRACPERAARRRGVLP